MRLGKCSKSCQSTLGRTSNCLSIGRIKRCIASGECEIFWFCYLSFTLPTFSTVLKEVGIQPRRFAVQSVSHHRSFSVALFLRLQKDRVFYASEDLMKKATNINRDSLACFGTCVGKFTHHKNFHILITCLPLLADLCQVRRTACPSLPPPPASDWR